MGVSVFGFFVKRAGRHFGFFKRAGRHEKGAGRHALQKKPRQNTERNEEIVEEARAEPIAMGRRRLEWFEHVK